MNYLVHSVKIGDLDSIKQALLKRYGSEVNINYDDYLKDGWTLMLHAVFNIQFNVVSYLINQKANVNHQAGKFRKQFVAKLLLRRMHFPQQIR